MKYIEIDQLNHLNENSDREDIDILFTKLERHFRVYLKIPQNHYVYRSRIQQNRFEVNSRSDLSYHPIPDKINIGRANLKNQQVFYGSTYPHLAIQFQDICRRTAILETSNIIKTSETNSTEFGYLSRWKITKELNLFAYLFFDFGESTTRAIKDYRERSIRMIEEQSPEPKRDLEINHWLSKQFAQEFRETDKNKYIITSMFANSAMKKEHDGVLYPTVKGKANSINIALTPEAANSLQLEYVCEFVNIMKNNRFQTISLRDCRNINEGKLKGWENCP